MPAFRALNYKFTYISCLDAMTRLLPYQEYKFFDGLVLSEKGNKKVWCNVISEEYPTAMPLEASYGKRILSETESRVF